MKRARGPWRALGELSVVAAYATASTAFFALAVGYYGFAWPAYVVRALHRGRRHRAGVSQVTESHSPEAARGEVERTQRSAADVA